MKPARPRFTEADADRANEVWGSNCGPGAIAAITNMTLDELRPHLGDFEQKHYTNPTLMFDILRRLGVAWQRRQDKEWPDWGLVRIQWEGPWTKPGVPPRVAYRHTHWVGCCRHEAEIGIFDINCMASHGWVSRKAWSDIVVPWLLEECVPKASGGWHITHSIDVARPA